MRMPLAIATLVTLFPPVFVMANTGCEYDGIKYKNFETVTVISPEYTEEIMKAGYSADGYAIVLTCAPLIDHEVINKGEFSINELPTQNKSAWVSLDHSPTPLPFSSSHHTGKHKP